MASIIATVLTTELAGERFVNHRESEVLVIIEVVQDRGLSLGEGFSLRGLENIGDIDVVFEEFQRLQSVADITEVAIDVGLGVAIPVLRYGPLPSRPVLATPEIRILTRGSFTQT